MDAKAMGILSCVLRVNDLLKCGVAMHSLIQDRTPLPDVAAVYFIEPTPQNVAEIVSDLRNESYSDFYVNFTSSIPRQLLEDFSKKVAELGKQQKVHQVFDQYLDFTVTEENMFSLEMPNVFTQFNDAKTEEDSILSLIDQISNQLFATIIVSGSIPTIRAPPGGAAESVALKLSEKLRDHVINTRHHHHQHQNGEANGVLILLDRSFDLASMLAHSWNYACLVFDIFKLSRNTITVEGPNPKKYDIEPKDFIWSENASLPYPVVTDNVAQQMTQLRTDTDELSKKTGISSLEDINLNENTDTSGIQHALKVLPEITARRPIINMHLEILHQIQSELSRLKLYEFCNMEQSISDPQSQKQFLDFLKDDDSTDNLEDKVRTLAIFILVVDDLQDSFVQSCESYLKEHNANLDALQYVKKVHSLKKSMSKLNAAEAAEQQSSGSRAYGLLFNSLKNFISSEREKSPLTRLVESIMEPTKASKQSLKVTDGYLYFDPNETRGFHSKPPPQELVSYQSGTVFVIGGGNYVEYQNIQEWAKSEDVSKQVAYGSTQIMNAAKFLAECESLGRE